MMYSEQLMNAEGCCDISSALLLCLATCHCLDEQSLKELQSKTEDSISKRLRHHLNTASTSDICTIRASCNTAQLGAENRPCMRADRCWSVTIAFRVVDQVQQVT